MECVVQVVRGDSLEKIGVCNFCDNQGTNIFGITKGKKHDGIIMAGFYVCKKHQNKLNALLSGEFDIDQIFLDSDKIIRTKRVNMRCFPPISLAKTKHKKFWQTCSFIGCTNRYYGIKNQKYCTDPRCKELRGIIVKTKSRKKLSDSDAKNLILNRNNYNKHLKKGQVLKIRCRAINPVKDRCLNTFLITYDPKQNIYPMFCECHRSAYKRLLFQRGKNA